MRSSFSRRNLITGIAATAFIPAFGQASGDDQDDKKPWWLGDGMPQENACNAEDRLRDRSARRSHGRSHSQRG